MNNIPQSRIFLYGILLGLLPLFFVSLMIRKESQGIEEIADRIKEVHAMAMSYKKRQAVNQAARNHYRDADHFYIDKELESLSFLEEEVEALEKIMNNKNFAGDPHVKKRLDHLTGVSNSLVYTEGVVQSYPLYQETTETLTHSVEVNVEDIQKILSKVEGVEIGPYKPLLNRPQLIVLEFKFDKKVQESSNEIFNLNMKLLKREYL